MADNQNNQNGSNSGGLTKDKDVLDPTKSGNKQSKGIGESAQDLRKKVDGAKKAGGATKAVIGFLTSNPVGWVILIVIIIIIVVVGFYYFFTTIPGLAIQALKSFAQGVWDNVQSWFTTSADAFVNEEDVINLANYLEELEYDLVGDGFIVPTTNTTTDYPTYDQLLDAGYEYGITEYDSDEDGKKESAYRYYYIGSEDNLYLYGIDNYITNDDGDEIETSFYYNSIGVLVDNKTGNTAHTGTTGTFATVSNAEYYVDKYGFKRSTEDLATSGQGKIVSTGSANVELLRTYLLSDYRIYVVKNNDTGILESIYAGLASTFGGNKWGWAKGLMMFYESKNGVAYDKFTFVEDQLLGGDKITVVDENTMKIKHGYFNNPITFNIDGWADRYGMSLEFLLSLHLATGAPDLVYAMLQSFDTEVQVYLDDSGEATVTAGYVDFLDENEGTAADSLITAGDVKSCLEEGGFDVAADLNNTTALLSWLSSLSLTKKSAQYLLRNLPLTSLTSGEYQCLGSGQGVVIEVSTNQTGNFLCFDTSSNWLADYKIIEDIDPEIYAEEDEYLNYYAYNDSGEEIKLSEKFTLAHITYSLKEADSDDLNVTESAKLYNPLFSAEAYEKGFRADNSESEVISDSEITELDGKDYYNNDYKVNGITTASGTSTTSYVFDYDLTDMGVDDIPIVLGTASYSLNGNGTPFDGSDDYYERRRCILY